MTFLLKKFVLNKIDRFSLGEKKKRNEKGKIEYSVNESQSEGWSDVGPVFTAEGERKSVFVGGGGHHEDHWGLLDPSCCSEYRPTHIQSHMNTHTQIHTLCCACRVDGV